MIGYGTSGTTHDFFCYNASGQVWNGSAFVTWVDGDYASYRISATEAGASGRFSASDITDAARYDMRERGATLATSYVVWESGVDEAVRSLIQAGAVAISQLDGEDIIVFVGETDSIELPTAGDYSGETLQVVFDNRCGVDVATVADGSLTKTTSSVSFNKPAAVTASARTLSYSLRRTSDGKVRKFGKCYVQQAAKADS